MLTLDEMIERMGSHWDIIDILEVLNITAADLLDRFDDRILDRFDELNEELIDGDG